MPLAGGDEHPVARRAELDRLEVIVAGVRVALTELPLPVVAPAPDAGVDEQRARESKAVRTSTARAGSVTRARLRARRADRRCRAGRWRCRPSTTRRRRSPARRCGAARRGRDPRTARDRHRRLVPCRRRSPRRPSCPVAVVAPATKRARHDGAGVSEARGEADVASPAAPRDRRRRPAASTWPLRVQPAAASTGRRRRARRSRAAAHGASSPSVAPSTTPRALRDDLDPRRSPPRRAARRRRRRRRWRARIARAPACRPAAGARPTSRFPYGGARGARRWLGAKLAASSPRRRRPRPATRARPPATRTSSATPPPAPSALTRPWGAVTDGPNRSAPAISSSSRGDSRTRPTPSAPTSVVPPT